MLKFENGTFTKMEPVESELLIPGIEGDGEWQSHLKMAGFEKSNTIGGEFSIEISLFHRGNQELIADIWTEQGLLALIYCPDELSSALLMFKIAPLLSASLLLEMYLGINDAVEESDERIMTGKRRPARSRSLGIGGLILGLMDKDNY